MQNKLHNIFFVFSFPSKNENKNLLYFKSIYYKIILKKNQYIQRCANCLFTTSFVFLHVCGIFLKNSRSFLFFGLLSLCIRSHRSPRFISLSYSSFFLLPEPPSSDLSCRFGIDFVLLGDSVASSGETASVHFRPPRACASFSSMMNIPFVGLVWSSSFTSSLPCQAGS